MDEGCDKFKLDNKKYQELKKKMEEEQ